MKAAIVGMTGKPPTVKVKSPANADIDLAQWHEKMAAKVENHSKKYLATAAKLRELSHIRPYARHHASCMAIRLDSGSGCTCGLDND